MRKTCLFIFILAFLSDQVPAQLPATIPWSSTVNITFGNGTTNPGPPLPVNNSDFIYTTQANPAPGYYSVIVSNNDAGHIFFGPFTREALPTGYKMTATYNAPTSGKILFKDTVRGLCSNNKYLFWAGINNLISFTCLKPNLTFSVETTTGTVIASFQTGDIGGPIATDNYTWYPGYYDRTRRPKVPFYGGTFLLPPGVRDIVLKIISNPSTAPLTCSAQFEVDNILLTPVGPDLRISSQKYPGGWIAGTCFQGNSPLELFGKFDPGYLDFGTPNYINQTYTNPGFQWQQSLDEGYTWTDIPGETNINISHTFNIPDTFWVRLRTSELADIGNKGCSNVSNIIQVQNDTLPQTFSFTTNSPVCTDGDLVLKLSGGVTYYTYGPNGYFDDSPFPHIYHPKPADSGWYYSEIYTFGGCKAVDSEFVRVVGPDLAVSKGKKICYSDTVHLHATGGTKYVWTPADGLDNPKVANPVAMPLITTTYEVKATDNSGCSAVANVTLTLRNGLLKVGFDYEAVACPGDTISFANTSVGQITNWQWSFGNGNTSSVKDPPSQTYVVTNGSYFPVQLTITDTSGCAQTLKKYIQTVNNCFIAVPTAFTPDNDGLNDFLFPLNAYKAKDLIFQVFNRNGRVVFESRDINKKWDGTIGGIPQATGVYVWMLRYTDERKNNVFLKGTVTLIRK